VGRTASIVAIVPLAAVLLACAIAVIAVIAIMRSQETARRAASRANELATAFENIAQGLVMYDANHRLVAFNSQARQLFGLRPEQLRTGMSLHEVLDLVVSTGTYSHSEARAAYAEWDALIALGKPTDYVRELSDGTVIEVSHRPLAGGGWVATFEDISEHRRAEEYIAYLIRHDALTTLPNELLFLERLRSQVAFRAPDRAIAVLCIGLAGLGTIRDALGRDIGDSAVKAVAELLVSSLLGTTVLARLSSDEFTLAQPGLAGPQAAEKLAEKIMAMLEKPLRIGDHDVAVIPGIGIAMLPDDASDAETALKCAHVALARTRHPGSRRLIFFAPEMNLLLESRRTLELDLSLALEGGQFCLFYQPIVDLRSWKIETVEALLRWNHPRRGILGPDAFLSTADDMGLTIAIGEWVLARACADAAGWKHATTVCVNLSAPQFLAPDIADTVQRALAAADLPAHRLQLEITETALLHLGA
jgi:diguanylate cyclase (GGDEF)-like protein/PAS domain S-box-containing protein